MSLHNLEAEQALLGAMLFDNVIAQRITPALSAAHFFDPVHGRIFDAIRDMIAVGRVADAITLKERFAQDGGIQEIGGARYLVTLLENAAPLSIHAQSYAELIVEHAEARAAESACLGALAAVRAGGDPSEAVRALESYLREAGGMEGSARSEREVSRDVVAHADRVGLSTGLPTLDDKLGGLYPAELIVLGGRPSMGKTALANQIARNVAERGVVHFASMDMSKEALAARGLSARSYRREYGHQRFAYFALRAGAPGIDRRLLAELAEEAPDTLIVDDRAGQTCEQLEQSARATRKRCGRLDLIVADYLQLMRAPPGVEGRVNQVGAVSAGLKDIAKRLKCPVLALSQLSRSLEGRDNKRPTMADLRESGAIEQDADIVLGCYRESYYLERNEPGGDDPEAFRKWQAKRDACANAIEIIRLKQRHGPIGADVLVAHIAYDTILDRRAA